MTGPTATDARIDVDALVRFTQELVRIRSVHEPETGSDESAAAALVADLMRGWGWEPQVTEVAPGRPNVIAVVEGGGGDGPTLGFEGHTDVVTEGDRASWSVDPFGAEIRDGRLYGRGTADMKAGVASMLFAVRALQQAGPFPGRVVLCVLADEEGLMLGAKHFAGTELARRIDACIVCEPEGDEVCVAAKGAVRIGLDFHGRMAHGAMPHQGRNPVVAAARLVAALAAYEDELRDAHPEHEHLGVVHVTPTVLDAGSHDQINVIPAEAAVRIDVRTLPGVDHAALVERVTAIAREGAEPLGVTVEATVIDDRPAVEIDPDHPVVRAVVAAHERECGTRPAYGGVPGATDGTILQRDAGVPCVVYGPGDKWIAHQVDEHVPVADLDRYARIYADAARAFLTAGA
ncbi:M20 family metallopeptidase [Patulibacter sp. SYSU D01012]|uniref:M20 family metallopeptidase n=1 Tax=Patulibacter sp. SYSU D01012 TaxID=2817381 RepID=UPI001B30B25B|nr:M20 family metallopeptidase [Patulibacter sp. SYSU D01012]